MKLLSSLVAGAAIACTTTAQAGDFYSPVTEGPVSMTFDVGLANIYAEESVFEGSTTVSRLDWEAKGVTLLRGSLSIEVARDWSVRAEGKTGMDGDGHMTDRDWLAPYTTALTDDGWSHRSDHDDTHLDHYFSGSLEVNRTLINDNGRFVSAGLGGRYSDVQWSAYGGSYIYSVNGVRDTTGNFADGLKGVTYRQKMPAAYANIRGSQTMGDWTLSGGLEAGALIRAEAPDDHWLRSLRFTDSFDLAAVYGANAGIAYNLTRNISLYANGAFEMTDFGTGDTHVRSTTTGATAVYEDAAGAKFSMASVSLGLKGKF